MSPSVDTDKMVLSVHPSIHHLICYLCATDLLADIAVMEQQMTDGLAKSLHRAIQMACGHVHVHALAHAPVSVLYDSPTWRGGMRKSKNKEGKNRGMGVWEMTRILWGNITLS